VPTKKEKQPLSVTHPDLAKEADGWDPSLITAGVNTIVTWKCSQSHRWKASVFRRANGAGCPVCSNRKVISGINDFATTHPELAKEISQGDPTCVTAGSDKKMTWRCSLGHIWEASVGSRVLRNTGCPICAGVIVLSGFNDLLTLFPEIALQADGWDPKTISPGSHKYFKWKCSNGHTWEAKVQSRVVTSSKRNEDSVATGCPYCHGRKAWQGFNDLQATHPEIAKKLVDQSEATQVTFGSELKLNWICEKGHIFQARVYDMSKPGSHCPFCSGSKVLEGFNDLTTTHPSYSAQLIDINPREVSAGSKRVGQWRCELGHVWKSSINSRISNSTNCPICSGALVLKGFNDIATSHPELVSEVDGWDPATLTRGSGRVVGWKCQYGHKWKAKPTDRTTRGSGCPTCSVFGFDPNKNGYLYFLSHPLWGLLQIGITNVPKKRLAVHKNIGWEILELRGPMDGLIARKWERAILRMLKANGADLSNAEIAGKFDGYSEAWSKATFEVNSIKELMQLTEEFEGN
jgi:hypothetical protein